MKALLALMLMATGAMAEDMTAVPQFIDETTSSGLTSVYAGEWLFMVGGGVSTFDCNDDARPDLVMSGGESPASLWLNRSDRGGALRFDRAEGAGVEMTGVTGSYPMDIDSDGISDLAVLRVGENVVLRGLGQCRFERANERWGFDGGDAWSTALAATWEKDADWPTIAVACGIRQGRTNFRRRAIAPTHGARRHVPIIRTGYAGDIGPLMATLAGVAARAAILGPSLHIENMLAPGVGLTRVFALGMTISAAWML